MDLTQLSNDELNEIKKSIDGIIKRRKEEEIESYQKQLDNFINMLDEKGFEIVQDFYECFVVREKCE